MISLLREFPDPLPKATILLAGYDLAHRRRTLLSVLFNIFLDFGNEERKARFFQGRGIATGLFGNVVLTYKGAFRQSFGFVAFQALERCAVQIAQGAAEVARAASTSVRRPSRLN